MSSKITPSEDDLKSALVSLKTENPALGIPKLHVLLLSSRSDWSVSEKRTRKVLQNAGLVVSPQPIAGNKIKGHIYPSSRLVEGLDVTKWTKKVEVKYFDAVKGKGLVATEKIAEGEVIWKEDPFIVAPEWSIYNLQLSSRACAHCTTPLTDSPLTVACPSSTSSTPCHARFCNRLCLSRSSNIHPLLCPPRNPACIPLMTFIGQMQWLALNALAQFTARILLSYQSDENGVFGADWALVRGLAELSMEDRFKGLADKGVQPDRATWKKAHQIFIQAFHDPPTDQAKKKLAKILKKPLTPEIEEELFPYGAFLRGLGRMSLNQEGHGGIYALHSHMNHSCSPNVSVRHLDQRTALSRITLIAKAEIDVGQELLVSYVDPTVSVTERRGLLPQWGFGNCQCERCVEEEKALPDDKKGAGAMDDLASELKAGLGVGGFSA
ncbi:hypothetical protein JAAARDRAFT_36713 [Jaapia argillacea MUCL 33604]|uniref:Histone-lysine N-methyltransferase SET5 n=1 Tax=Jaapia argillacea MUCL 33604 TaxID=933084 RepID=A0A067PXF5_9AGAM|nr:hypothetical protein JAAARDRAFT_36713 [Jaapia argillacea MUCL 33604]